MWSIICDFISPKVSQIPISAVWTQRRHRCFTVQKKLCSSNNIYKLNWHKKHVFESWRIEEQHQSIAYRRHMPRHKRCMLYHCHMHILRYSKDPLHTVSRHYRAARNQWYHWVVFYIWAMPRCLITNTKSMIYIH